MTTAPSKSNQLSISSLATFKSELFEGKELRVFGTSEEPLFVMKDIASLLDLKNYRNVYSTMDEYMKKGVQQMDTLGGEQEMQVVNESGLYYSIMRSNKEHAKDIAI